mgnify:CR=1 FL=1
MSTYPARSTSALCKRAVEQETAYKQITALKPDDKALFDILEAAVGEKEDWPVSTLTHMMSKHLKMPGRWNLTLFLLGNHAPPDVVASWYVQRQMLRDHDARSHVANLFQQHRDDKLNVSTWVLPSRVTFSTYKKDSDKSITAAEQRAMFRRGDTLVPAQYGNPAPIGSPMSINDPGGHLFYSFPINTPNITPMEGWRWERAYRMLMNYEMPMSAAKANEVKIVDWTDEDPDALPEDDMMPSGARELDWTPSTWMPSAPHFTPPHGFTQATIDALRVRMID